MAKQVINIGTVANDGTGDPIRTSFDKTNQNFTELYDNQFSGNYNDLTNKPTIPSALTDLGITDGNNGQVLTTDGAGNFTFAAGGSGGGTGLASRATLSGSTGNIANNGTINLNVAGYKGYLLYKIQTSGAAWVRVYTDSASRSADSSRTQGSDPAPDAGVIAEIITTAAETIIISPGAIGFNNDSPVTDNIPLTVTNLTGGVNSITVTLTAVELEV